MAAALPGADLSVILDFEASHSTPATAAMKLEAEKLLKGSGVTLEWRMLSELSPEESFPRIAVVKLKGRCEMTPFVPAAADVAAPLGITYREDGRVIPFSEVECDRVRSTLGGARLTANPEARELLFGRALGRVLAHELLHVVNHSGRHTKDGVTQKYLSAARLTGEQID
ncbi:MAG TPA: hypothetical protein VKR61_02000 [Bryobacteraceae bacterium]|nr:hypothetical protein [Bryobacteraceae bacterium]